AVSFLPSFPIVALQIQQAGSRIVTYQCLNHERPGNSYRAFASWARKETLPDSGLRWWETGAPPGSSLSVLALISAAARPTLPTSHVTALDGAYFPWIGSLHAPLDSLIAEPEDAISDQHCLTALYASHEEAASRLQTLAVRASEHARGLPDGNLHTMMLAAMVSSYLAGAQGSDPRVKLAAKSILPIFGDHAAPAMFVLRARHTVRLLARGGNKLPR